MTGIGLRGCGARPHGARLRTRRARRRWRALAVRWTLAGVASAALPGMAAEDADATLSSLTVDGVGVVGFDGARSQVQFDAGVWNTSATPTVAAVPTASGATVTYATADAGSRPGHQVAVAAGASVVVEIVVANPTTQRYFVRIGRGLAGAYQWTAAKDVRTLVAAGNRTPFGIWANGETMWIADAGAGSVYAYRRTTGARWSYRDLDLVAVAGGDGSGLGQPAGVWGSDRRLWVADRRAGRVLAYRWTNRWRADEDRSFDLASDHSGIGGLWSDGETMWVGESGAAAGSRLLAYALAGGGRVAGKDFDALGSAGNTRPAGIWSDGETMWVADWGQAKLFAYDLATRARTSGRDFDTLAGVGNDRPTGIWSDGETMWVADHEDASVYAYQLAESANAELGTLTVDGAGIAVSDSAQTAFTHEVAHEVARATVVATARHPLASAEVVSPADADSTAEGHQVDLSPGGNEVAVGVTAQDGTTGSYALTITRQAGDPTLESLSLSGVDIGVFAADTTVYAASVPNNVHQTTVTAVAQEPGATVTVEPADADAAIPGHQVSLAVGANAVAVTVTLASVAPRTYSVTVLRRAPPEASVSATAATVAEGGAARFAVSLSAAQSVALSVSVSVTAEGAGLSAPVPTSATFAAGETTAALAVGTVDDAVVSGDGTVTATLSAGAGYALGTAGSASVAVTDDDAAEFAVSAQPAEVEEGGTSTVTVSIMNGVTYAEAQEIALSVSGDVDAGDYALPATTTLAAGASSATAVFAAAADDVDEEPETATVSASLDGAEIGAASVTVADQPPLPALRVEGVPQLGATLSAVFAEPANGPAADTARAAGGASPVSAVGPETVYRWLRDGAEIPGATGAAHVLTAADVGAAVSVRAARGIRSEESAATVPVWGAPGNPAVGTDEATLLSTTMTLGSRGFSMVELRVDFAGYMDETWYRPVGSLDAAAFELDGTRYRLTTFAVIQDGGFAFATQPVLPSAAGLVGYWDGYRLADFVGETADANGWTTWGTWTPQPREEYERYMHRPGRVFSGPSDGVRVAVSLRREVGVPTATVTATAATVSEGGAAAFAVTLDGPREAPVTVSLETAVAGAALAAAAPSSATFAPGETRASLDLATVDDAVVSGDGTVTVTLVAGDGYELGASTTATVSVAEDDAAQFAVSASPAEVVEGASSTVTVAVANGVTYATAREVSLSVTGTVSASDYALPATVALAAGASSATAEFAALEDEVAEEPETATVTASVDGAAVGAATVAIRPLRRDATLSSLSLTDVDIGVFDPETTAYAATVANDVGSTTVSASPSDASATVSIADAAGSTLGTRRTSALAEGTNDIAATVTAEDGATTRSYAVTVTRPPVWGARRAGRDIDLGDAAYATGLWSDGATLWAVRDWNGTALAAYDLATGARRESADLALSSAGWQWSDVHSDGATLWASSLWGEVQAYRLSDGARAAHRDVGTAALSEAGSGAPSGLFSSAGTLWVVDQMDRAAYAFAASDGARLADADIDLGALLDGEAEAWPWGAWSDGEVLLTSNSNRAEVRAYRLSGAGAASRAPALDLDTGAAGNGDPRGLWSDGETLWVADGADGKAYAYAVPGLRAASATDVESRAAGVPSAAPGRAVAMPDPALRAAVAAALGKPPHSPVGANELAALESLEARAAGIADLSGLEHAARLQALDLGGNPLADVRALASLPRLADLRLDATGAQPWDVATLTGLRRLSLRSNGIDDVSGLAPLVRLEHLDIGGNRIADLWPLANLHRLANLRADGNRVADVAPLLALPSLATLDLRGNPVDDTEALERLPR